MALVNSNHFGLAPLVQSWFRTSCRRRGPTCGISLKHREVQLQHVFLFGRPRMGCDPGFLLRHSVVSNVFNRCPGPVAARAAQADRQRVCPVGVVVAERPRTSR